MVPGRSDMLMAGLLSDTISRSPGLVLRILLRFVGKLKIRSLMIHKGTSGFVRQPLFTALKA